MAAVKTTNDTESRRAVAITRGLVHAFKAKTAGPEFLLAGVLYVLGLERGAAVLTSLGIDRPESLLASLLSRFQGLHTTFRPVRPSPELEVLLRGELAPFLAGQTGAEDAAKILLSAPACAERIKQLLTSLKSPPSGNRAPASVESTRVLLRDLSRFYQRRWRLGHVYHTVSLKQGTSDFADGRHDEDFFKAVDGLYADEQPLFDTLFSGKLYQESPLGGCWRELGEIPAHALGLVLLGEIGQVGDGPLSVREIAFSLAPKYFHRYLAVARSAVAELYEHSLVQAISGGEVAYLGQTVVPTPEVLEEFLSYLRIADPISAAEQADILRGLR